MGTIGNGPSNLNAIKAAEITLWVMLTTRPDLFSGGGSSLPPEFQDIIYMVRGDDNLPDPRWKEKVTTMFNKAGAADFQNVRRMFTTVCSDGWGGSGHPKLTEFTVVINSGE